jgi:N-acetyl-gamma-glutamyl-phosphate reductase
LVKAKLVDPATLIADCKSGVSGAGRGASLATSYCEAADSFKAYKVFEHRHTPEMEQELSYLAQEPVRLTFTPHLTPMSRGILATLYACLRRPAAESDLFRLYQEFYAGQPFVRLMPPGALPATSQVRGTNYCDIGLKVHPDGRRVIVVAAIDNLARGASAQAVCNFNLMAGFPETLGLDQAPLTP